MLPKNLPRSQNEFKKSANNFKKWLGERGSEIREPSNPYELLRFTTPEGVGVIYINAGRTITAWMNGAERAFLAFKGVEPTWRVGERLKAKSLSHQHSTIIARDGDECWFCGGAFVEGDPQLQLSTEHLVSRTQGGPNHLSNLVIAHVKCNNLAGNASVAEKVRLREKLRSTPKGNP